MKRALPSSPTTIRAKGKQLAINPRASLLLYWPHTERQIRIDGTVEKTDAATSGRLFSIAASWQPNRRYRLSAIKSCG
jgi:pyridoxine/pyridoxamine 5'-phosphate oxidase